MKISVLISVYKSEKGAYLNDALKSVWVDQSHKPDEVILIEDGPLTDDLYAVIKEWKDTMADCLVIVKNETNIGLTKSLNKGIDIAKYDVIARMDSDDKSHPQRFERQIAFLESHPEISVIGGSIQEFNDDNDCIGIRHYPSTHIDVLNYIYKASPLAHPAVMIRKSVFDGGIRYNEEYRTSQDLALWFDLISQGYQLANLEDVVLYFRHDGDIYKRRGREKAKKELKIYLNGIKRTYGFFTPKYAYPLMRYLFRLTPTSVKRFIYNSSLREKLLNK